MAGDNIDIIDAYGEVQTVATKLTGGLHYQHTILYDQNGNPLLKDLDTGAGNDYAVPVVVRVPASGGGKSVQGDDTNGLDVDVTKLPIYTAPLSGEIAGGTSAAQLPSVACKMVCIKAKYNNVGRFAIGVSASVSLANGSGDSTAGFELIAGEMTPWLLVSNLNLLWRICDNSGDSAVYLVLA